MKNATKPRRSCCVQGMADFAHARFMRTRTSTGERVAKLAWNLMLSTGCASSIDENRFSHSLYAMRCSARDK